MIVTTSEAAKILNISSARLRVLLIEGRVEGAYKSGKMWMIPLFKGEPIIEKRKRGPAPRWHSPRKPAATIIHVNTHNIKSNQKTEEKEPVIAVKKWNSKVYGYGAVIPGGCRVIYKPGAKGHGGAQVWIESLYDVEVQVEYEAV